MSIYQKRLKDWRNGAIVYQVIVDRFNPPHIIDKSLYPYPKQLKAWHETPKSGVFLPEVRYWSHELDFWGGNFKSLMDNMDYIKQLNVDVLYLNPIFESLSNHKYDATDYLKISKEYGSKEDLLKLIEITHQLGMKIILDGVFNHVGVQSDLFQSAKDLKSPYRDFFDFNPKYPEGVRLWADAKSLPELNLENPKVKDYIYRSEQSVIKSYLKDGIDGWRLDVAFDIGFKILKELTDAAHSVKEDALIVGEIWNYPEQWLKSIDGVMNFTFREIMLRLIKGEIKPNKANQMIRDVILSSGIEPILKSWLLLDNHDVPRLSHQLPDIEMRKLAQVLQFTLPGSPNLYYGTELGMNGGNDPENRAPMRWDIVDDNQTLSWIKSLIELHQNEVALKVGDYVSIDSDLFGFMRITDRIEDTVIVLMNPTDHVIEDTILLKDSRLMNYTKFDFLMGEKLNLTFLAGLVKVSLNPKTFTIFKPHTTADQSYTPYKRV
jgi:cyclomaltodextrinase / maltogenic alpha-amylase / neopullulanase